jgi:hypothetical protein
MTNDNIVQMPNPALHPAPVIIDDSRLQTIWDRQHRRQNWIVGGCCATALLIAGALVVMAFRINAEPPKVEVAAPAISIPAPVVNVTVPEQKAPVVNVTVPPVPTAPAVAAQPLRTGESKVVTEHSIFHTATVGKYSVITGWEYHSSNDATPHTQFCYVNVSRTGRLFLANEGVALRTIEADARSLGMEAGIAETLIKSCRWFNGGSSSGPELRDPTR